MFIGLPFAGVKLGKKFTAFVPLITVNVVLFVGIALSPPTVW